MPAGGAWRRGAAAVLAAIIAAGTVAGLCAADDVVVPYVFRSWGVRDPFKALQSTKVKPELVIYDLILTGIIDIGGGRVAIFKRREGPDQTYQLKGSRLFGKDGRMVPAIRGKVIDERTVLLVQGDEEIPFKLGVSELKQD